MNRSRREHCVALATAVMSAYANASAAQAFMTAPANVPPDEPRRRENPAAASLIEGLGEEIDLGTGPCSFLPTPRVLHAAWDRLDAIGLEVAEVRITPQSIDLTGNGVLEIKARSARLRYSISCDGNWQVEHAKVTLDERGSERTLSLDRIDGGWRVNDVFRSDLSGCLDIDIMGTPSTNTLPIRRLSWQANESRDLRMAFVGLPDLEVRPMTQRYSRIADGPRGTQHFRYENLTSGFRADLLLDSDGLVLDYPPIWRRAPQSGALAGVPDDFAGALISSSRSPEIRAEEDFYAGLIGVWDVDVRDRQDDGSFRSAKGEWLFARALEGRAIQDVWISPPRNERTAAIGKAGNRYGSSVRTFDPNTRTWQTTWFNPVSGAFDVLKSRMQDGRLIQEGRRPDGQQIRWMFLDITPSSFHWTGEALQSNGTWQLEAEFRGRRRHPK